MGINVGHNRYSSDGNFQVGGTETDANVGIFNPQNQDTIDLAGQTGLVEHPLNISGKPDLVQPMEPVADLGLVSNLLQSIGPSHVPAPQQSPGQVIKDQQAIYTGNFYSELDLFAQANNLSEDDKAQLVFAFYNPDANTPNIKLKNGSSLAEVLKTLIGKAQTDSAGEGVDISQLGPVDNTAFNLNLSDGYNIAFEQAVNNSDDLTQDEKATLIFMHYNPDTNIPNVSTKLLAMQADLEKAALQQIGPQLGIPANWQPPLNSNIYNGTLNKEFQTNLQIAFDDYASTNGLSDEQIIAVKSAIQNMKDPNIPADIKAAAQKILDQATKTTQSDHNLPIEWQPSVEQMSSIFSDISSDPVVSAFVQASEMLNSAINKIKLLMPDGPEKTTTMALLEAISQAINKARASIYELEQANSQLARRETIAKVDAQQQILREQQAERKDIGKQLEKQQKMHSVMKILDPIMKVMEVAMIVATGGLMGVVFFALDTKYHLVDMLIKQIVKAAGEVADALIPANASPDMQRLKEGIKIMVQVAIMMAVLAFFSTAGSSVISPMQLMNVGMKIFTESEIVNDFCAMVGIPKKDVVWVILAVALTFTLVMAIVAIASPGAGAGAARTGATIAAGQAERLTVQVTENVGNTMEIIEVEQVLVREGAAQANTASRIAREAVETSQNMIQKMMDQVNQSINNVLNSISNGIKNIKAFQKFLELLEKISGKLDSHQKALSRFLTGVSVIQSLVNAGASGIRGGVAITQLEIVKIKKKHEPLIVELQAMIKMLQKLIDSILRSLEGASEDLTDLGKLHSDLLRNLSNLLKETTSIRPQ